MREPRIYGVAIAHKDGLAVERVLPGRYVSMVQARRAASIWSRHHENPRTYTDKCGFYAYADRINRGQTGDNPEANGLDGRIYKR